MIRSYVEVLFEYILATLISPTVSMLSEGNFPECFKTAKKFQNFKSGDSNFTVNFRPISILPSPEYLKH